MARRNSKEPFLEIELPLRPGELIGQDCYVLALINYGMMGEVYKAVQVINDAGRAHSTIQELLKSTTLEHELYILKKKKREAEKNEPLYRFELQLYGQRIEQLEQRLMSCRQLNNNADVAAAINELGHRPAELRLVAVKFYDNDRLSKREFAIDLLQHELALMSKCDHQNLVHLIRKFETPKGIGAIMSYIDGIELYEIVHSDIRKSIYGQPEHLQPEVVFALGFQLAQALSHLHSLGIVHNDVQPRNVLVEYESGLAKLIDLSVARSANEHPVAKKRITGTALYFSPQKFAQCEYTAKGWMVREDRDLVFDHRDDLWALGVMLYELLATRSPWMPSHPKDLSYLVQNVQHSPIAHHNPYLKLLPLEEKALYRALEKNQEKRYQSGDEFADAMLDCLKARGFSLSNIKTILHDFMSWMRSDRALSRASRPEPQEAEKELVGTQVQ